MSVRVVLTAAHCVQGRAPGSLMVRLGEWDASATTEALPTQANMQITKKRNLSRLLLKCQPMLLGSRAAFGNKQLDLIVNLYNIFNVHLYI